MTQVKILAGLPGSGKSTYAKHLLSRCNNGLVVSADNFFMQHGDGTYHFEPSLLANAHASCFASFLEGLEAKAPLLVVDNTNLQAWQIAPYVLAAQSFGVGLGDDPREHPGRAEIQVIRLSCNPEVAFQRQTHNVPQHVFADMVSQWANPDYPPRWAVWETPADKGSPDKRWVKPYVERCMGPEFFQNMRWSAEGCWLGLKAGMAVGVEPDGYTHS